MKIVNVVSNEENINKFSDLRYVNILRFTNIEDIDYKLPTLFIGYFDTKKVFPNLNILEKKINNNIYWTFSFSEKKGEYLTDINNFIENSLEMYFSKFIYFNIDPFFSKIKSTDDIINIIGNNSFNCYINHLKFMYIYDGEKKIYSIDLNILNYVGINYIELITKLKNSGSQFYIDKNNAINNAFLNYFSNIDIVRRYIVYFISRDFFPE